jgi:C_GCAxxG_C_C family probable redox protein
MQGELTYMDNLMRVMGLKQQGFYCSQIMVSMGLEDQGKSNPDLVRAARGLAVGLGGAQNVCGALTGGACLLGLYAGKGLPEEQDDPRLNEMVQALVAWFEDEIGGQYGSILCGDILEGDLNNAKARCPAIIVGVYEKMQELLAAHGFDEGD